jgi:hypothetical protein
VDADIVIKAFLLQHQDIKQGAEGDDSQVDLSSFLHELTTNVHVVAPKMSLLTIVSNGNAVENFISIDYLHAMRNHHPIVIARVSNMKQFSFILTRVEI